MNPFEEKITKKRLEIMLQRVKWIEKPKVMLEQYQTPPSVAAELLYLALLQGDIRGKKVVDLGCGTGILSIGAWILGAHEVVGVDIDENMLRVAQLNSKEIGAKVRWVKSDVETFHERCDTVVQNPPFGTKVRSADIVFLKKALQISKVTYTIHKAGNWRFIFLKVAELGRRVTHVTPVRIEIPWSLPFHKKARYHTFAEIYRIE